MKKEMTTWEIGRYFSKQLGLPRWTRKFTLTMEANEMPLVQCEYYPDLGKADLEKVTYELHMIDNGDAEDSRSFFDFDILYSDSME